MALMLMPLFDVVLQNGHSKHALVKYQQHYCQPLDRSEKDKKIMTWVVDSKQIVNVKRTPSALELIFTSERDQNHQMT